MYSVPAIIPSSVSPRGLVHIVRAPALTRMSGSSFRPVRRFFCHLPPRNSPGRGSGGCCAQRPGAWVPAGTGAARPAPSARRSGRWQRGSACPRPAAAGMAQAHTSARGAAALVAGRARTGGVGAGGARRNKIGRVAGGQMVLARLPGIGRPGAQVGADRADVADALVGGGPGQQGAGFGLELQGQTGGRGGLCRAILRATTPQPEHRSAARCPGAGRAKRARAAARRCQSGGPGVQ